MSVFIDYGYQRRRALNPRRWSPFVTVAHAIHVLTLHVDMTTIRDHSDEHLYRVRDARTAKNIIQRVIGDNDVCLARR